ncbi:DUF2835 domain-containing protein [Methylomarinum sp. Ch1-1]|uniref:DUF2835 domain-containing protein n=1 Tax=Methylomarinum roseum TaxID=3067653 RepID=A0AAU7NRF8_9GAMM|nr:DUF2835 domain-containing protein [Methylomarinum sp. Ch1-1]MDP4520428.1 DUF2835 domain-containing protein [Methylomarinum sp. Ch1-1]
MNQCIRFHLHIGYDQYLSVYQGLSKTVRVKADDGRLIDFPAGNIQPFLTKDGIHGYFEMELSRQHKFIGIKKIR